jgi:hypothetical protein
MVFSHCPRLIKNLVVTPIQEPAMETKNPSYYVCGGCLADLHHDCAGIHEPGTCACNCQYALVGRK